MDESQNGISDTKSSIEVIPSNNEIKEKSSLKEEEAILDHANISNGKIIPQPVRDDKDPKTSETVAVTPKFVTARAIMQPKKLEAITDEELLEFIYEYEKKNRS